MSLPIILRALKRNILWILLFPTVLVGTVFVLTMNQPREYTTFATLYTGLVSGYTITSVDGNRVDNSSVNNAFDNLMLLAKSREARSETALRLLAHHLVQTKPSWGELSEDSYQTLNTIVPANIRRQIVVEGDESATFELLYKLYISPDDNHVKWLLYNSNSAYDIEALNGRVNVTRKNSSDMVELWSSSSDPAIAQQTIVYLAETMRRRYKEFKTQETSNVVKYYEEQVAKSLEKLKETEEAIKDYGLKNNIVNYDDQAQVASNNRQQYETEYNHELISQRATKAALNLLEEQLDDNRTIVMANTEVTTRRNELVKAQNRLANAEVYGSSSEEIERLRSTVSRLSEELKVAVRRHYNTTHAVGAVPQRQLMDDYIQRTTQLQESEARAAVLQRRMRESDSKYTSMAPIGLTLNRMQRERGLIEAEYLTFKNNLTQARLRLKNLEMDRQMSVLDSPAFPTKPQPSKRLTLIMMAAMAGLVLMLAFIIGREVLNSSIRTPERAEELIEMPLAAAMPSINKQSIQYDLPFIEQCMLEQLRSVTTLETNRINESGEVRPYHLITIFSTRRKQGKSWVGERISHQFAKAGHRVCYLYPQNWQSLEPSTLALPIGYMVEPNFADIRSIAQLLPTGVYPEAYDYIFLELPGLLETAVPVHLIGQSSMLMMVVDARTVWAKADRTLRDLAQQACTNRIMTVLNQVEPDFLEPILGKIPRRKSAKKASTGFKLPGMAKKEPQKIQAS